MLANIRATLPAISTFPIHSDLGFRKSTFEALCCIVYHEVNTLTKLKVLFCV